MNTGTLFWLIIFGISAATFFLVAAVVCFKGLTDLRILLQSSDTKKSSPEDVA